MKDAPASDRRSSNRYPLHLPVVLDGQSCTGETTDISSGGVLIRCDASYTVGAPITFSITVPGEAMGTEHDVHMQCQGHVMRCDPEGEHMAVGAIIDEYSISR